MVEVVRHGGHAIGKVSNWAQWLIIAAGVLLSPVFVLLLPSFIGWSLLRRLWRRRDVAPEPAPAPGLGGPEQLRPLQISRP
jgi:hypothetical protein